MLEIFIANAIRLPIKCPQLDSFSTNCLKFIKVALDNQVLKFLFDKNILLSIIKLAILDPLEKYQNDRFYNFNQYQIS